MDPDYGSGLWIRIMDPDYGSGLWIRITNYGLPIRITDQDDFGHERLEMD